MSLEQALIPAGRPSMLFHGQPMSSPNQLFSKGVPALDMRHPALETAPPPTPVSVEMPVWSIGQMRQQELISAV